MALILVKFGDLINKIYKVYKLYNSGPTLDLSVGLFMKTTL